MNFAFSITVVEASMLVSPKKVFIGRSQLHCCFIDSASLQTMLSVSDLLMGHFIAVREASIITGVDMLIRRLVIITNCQMAMHCDVFLKLSTVPCLVVLSKHLLVVIGRRADMSFGEMTRLNPGLLGCVSVLSGYRPALLRTCKGY